MVPPCSGMALSALPQTGWWRMGMRGVGAKEERVGVQDEARLVSGDERRAIISKNPVAIR